MNLLCVLLAAVGFATSEDFCLDSEDATCLLQKSDAGKKYVKKHRVESQKAYVQSAFLNAGEGKKRMIIQFDKQSTDDNLNVNTLIDNPDSKMTDVKVMGTGSAAGFPFVSVEGPKKQVNTLLKLIPSQRMVRAEEDVQVSPIEEIDLKPKGTLPAKATSFDANGVQTQFVPLGLDRIDERTGLDGRYAPYVTPGGTGVHIFVFDTGIRETHLDFTVSADGSQTQERADRFLEANRDGLFRCNGINFDTPCGRDFDGHGTHVAGSAGGTFSGVAKNVSLHGVKVIPGGLTQILQSIDFIISNPEASQMRPAIISASLGINVPSAGGILADAVRRARDDGILFVAAAGNDNRDACRVIPAATPDVFTVAATDPSTDRRARFSNFGRCVNIFAPGVSIQSASHQSDNGLVILSGTSQATPQVAGAMALELGQRPNLTPAQVEARLLRRRETEDVVRRARSRNDGLLFVGRRR